MASYSTGVTIDLTLPEHSDAEDASSDVEIVARSSSPPIRSLKGKGRAGDSYDRKRRIDEACWRSDEIKDLSASASSSLYSRTAPQVYCSEDERLARRLAEEDEEEFQRNAPPPNSQDERLARRLAEEEQANFDRIVRNVEARQEGIVFQVVVDVESNTLADGSPAHPDDLARFEPWKRKCEQAGVRVKKFHWIVNYELEKRFEKATRIVERLMGQTPEEIQLFHGTAPPNVKSILKGGFRIGGMDGHHAVNGTDEGYGVYLASDPNLPVGLSGGGNKIFACRVVPGRVTSSLQYSRNRPLGVEPGHELYESWSGVGVDMVHIYVVRYTCLVLPCYMIEYESPYYPQVWPVPDIVPQIFPKQESILPEPDQSYDELKKGLADWRPLPLAVSPGAWANQEAGPSKKRKRQSGRMSTTKSKKRTATTRGGRV